MSRYKTELRWFIVGKTGLYVGQRMTRNAMIAEHVSQLLSGMKIPGGPEFGELSEFLYSPLTEEHKRAWKYCRKRGDRAVRLPVRFPVSP